MGKGMNYLNFLSKEDIEQLVDSCNLKLQNMNNNSICFAENKEFALLFCEKNPSARNEFFDVFKNTLGKFGDMLDTYANGIVLYLNSFELYDSLNDKDYSNMLYKTFQEKFSINENLLNQYKKDFKKHHYESKQEQTDPEFDM